MVATSALVGALMIRAAMQIASAATQATQVHSKTETDRVGLVRRVSYRSNVLTPAAAAIITPIATQSIACVRSNNTAVMSDWGSLKTVAAATVSPIRAVAIINANKTHSARWRSTATAADQNAIVT